MVSRRNVWNGLMVAAALVSGGVLRAEAAATPGVDEVVAAFAKAVGGAAAVDRITTRETDGGLSHGPKVTYYWQKPDSVLLVMKGEKIGWNGSSGWRLSKKKRVTRLVKGEQKPLETDANPLRYIHLKQIYHDVRTVPPETWEGKPMDVLVAPNDLGATKFFFDRATHLLVRVSEKGETSAYFEHVTEFSDYKDVNGIQFPFRIRHTSTEPGGKSEDLHISKVKQNVPLDPEVFSRPNVGSVVLGGKR